jgi:hypothetical protein
MEGRAGEAELQTGEAGEAGEAELQAGQAGEAGEAGEAEQAEQAGEEVEGRLQAMRSLRRHRPAFRHMRFTKGSATCHFVSDPVLTGHLVPRCIYHRPETSTWVYKLHDAATDQPKACMKIFWLRRGESNTNGLAEVRFLRMFSFMARNGISPHSVLPAGHTTFTRREVRQLVGEDAREEGTYMVLLSECADSSFYRDLVKGTLGPYDVKVIIFQVVYTLLVIQDVLPSFRHNDLHLSNVLTRATTAPGVHRYSWTDSPPAWVDHARAPKQALLWDMYFSSVTTEDAAAHGISGVVPGKYINRRHCPSPYYDLHKFFDSLHTAISSDPKRYAEEQRLVDAVVPERLRGLGANKRALRVWEERVTTPRELLLHPYFAELYTRPGGALRGDYSSMSLSRLKAPAEKSPG